MFQAINSHKPSSDVFFLRYGGAVVGALASISGFVMLRHFRQALGLRKEAQISSNLSSTFIPCIGSFVYHFLFITPVIALEEEKCPLCLELRSASIQAFSGFFLPYSIGFINAAMTMVKLGGYVPTILNPIAFTKLSWQLAIKNNGVKKFAGLFFLNVFGAILIIHAEGYQLVQFQRRMVARSVMAKD